MEAPSGGGLRKRQQIMQANQFMFLWIIGVSAVVGFSIVLMVFLGQRILFGEKVIAEKEKTISTLEKNLAVVPDLQNNVRLLSTNEDLQSVKLDPNSSALQVVLDALPGEANSTAMASSLQTKLLAGVSGVTIESLKVEPVSGVEINSDDTNDADTSDILSGTIGFSFTVSTSTGNQESLGAILKRVERSIRPFDVTNLTIEGQGSRVLMTVVGVGYYEPAKKVELTDKVVRP